MKYFKLILILISLESCEYKNSIQFTEPQPAGINNSSSFNKHYQGEYLNPDDSSYLTISPLSLVRHKECTWTFSRLEMDSSFKNKSDEEIKTALLKEGMKCTIKNDSLFCNCEYRDTLFQVSEDSIIRFFKGAYFLNSKISDNWWEVGRLELKKKTLRLGYIYPNDSLFSAIPINTIYPIKNDSGEVVNYQMEPTKKELKKLIRAEGFKDVNHWIKVTPI